VLVHRLAAAAESSTVSVDISVDMLRVGKSRLASGAASRLVAGDMEHLPFGAGTFEKAVCLNALHHVPDMPAALREICARAEPVAWPCFPNLNRPRG
jgi:ubiquinone/menaquinone biosynthesis C-methylase UbiE